jgi:hypothetical protein
MSTATTGTGTITLGSARVGYASFQEAGIADGDRVTYTIEDGSSFEVGRGIYTASGATLSRAQILSSKVAGEAATTAPLVLSGAATVFVTTAAEDLLDLGPYFSVRSYGAVGDGTTPDHAAIQAAVDAAEASQFVKRVYLPDPAIAYTFGATIIIPEGIEIFGDNRWDAQLSRCKPAAGFSEPLFESADYGNSRVLRIGLRGLFIDGSSTTLTAIRANCQQSLFDNLAIKDCFTYGLHIGGVGNGSDEQALNNKISDCFIAGQIGAVEFYDGILLDYFTADTKITGSYVEACKDAAIRSRAYNDQITGCHLYAVSGDGGGAGRGYYSETSADKVFSGNYVELCAAEGVVMDGGGSDVGTLAATINGNVFRNIDTGNTSNGVIEISGSDVSAVSVYGNEVRRDAATSYSTPYFVYFNGITPASARVDLNSWQDGLVTTGQTNSTEVLRDNRDGSLNIKDFGAVGDAVEVASGCAITATDATLTAPALTFDLEDVGKTIVVVGAGAAGANLYTTIASFTSATEVELDDTAGTTVASGRIIFGTDDTAAIQAALVVGRRVIVPPGNYVTAGQLALTSADVLHGIGQPKIYPLISGLSAIGVTNLASLTSGNRVFNCRLENLDFDGAGSENSIGVDWTQMSSGIVRNVIAQDFSTGFRLRGIAYYNTFSITTAQLCSTAYLIHNDGADLSGPNHNRFEYSRVNFGDVGFFVDEDGSTNINDLVLLQPAVESLNTAGVAFRINADNLVAAISIIAPRIDVSNGSIVGFQFDDIGNTEKIFIENPQTSGVATLFSPAITNTAYVNRLQVLSTDKNFTPMPFWRMLATSAVAVSHTGGTTETTLATIAVPANAMGANGVLRVTALWSVGASNANAKVARVYYGGTSFGAASIVNAFSMQKLVQISNRNSVSSQIAFASSTNSFALGGANATGAVNSATALDVTLRVELANAADTITLEAYTVEICSKS